MEFQDKEDDDGEKEIDLDEVDEDINNKKLLSLLVCTCGYLDMFTCMHEKRGKQVVVQFGITAV